MVLFQKRLGGFLQVPLVQEFTHIGILFTCVDVSNKQIGVTVALLFCGGEAVTQIANKADHKI